MTELTPKQEERQRYRESNGRYKETTKCQSCGKHIGIDNYYSADCCNGENCGKTLVLCAKCWKVHNASDCPECKAIRTPQAKDCTEAQAEAEREEELRAEAQVDAFLREAEENQRDYEAGLEEQESDY